MVVIFKGSDAITESYDAVKLTNRKPITLTAEDLEQ